MLSVISDLLPPFDTRGYISWICAYISVLGAVILAHHKTTAERKRLKHQAIGYEQAEDVEMKMKSDSKNNHDASPRVSAPRYGVIDHLRGWTITFITFYHFMWNLAEEGFIPPIPEKNSSELFNQTVQFWIFFAIAFAILTEILHRSVFAGYAWFVFVTAICIPWHYWASQVSGVGMVMICIGISSFVQNENGFKWKKIFSRIKLLLIVSTCISIVTYVIFPTQFVYFGAVHCITLLSVIHLPFIGYPQFAILGSALVLLHYWLVGPVFILDIPVWQTTVDYMPWFSNFGYLLLGVHFGHMGWHKGHYLPRFLWGWGEPGIQWEDSVFPFLGRHSLFIFVAHQVVIFPIVKLAGWIFQSQIIESVIAV